MTLLVAAHTWAGGRAAGDRLDRWRPRRSSSPRARWSSAAGCRCGRWSRRWSWPSSCCTAGWSVLGPTSGHVHGPHLELTWQMVLAHVAGGLATALVWELRRRAVEVVLTWAEIGLLPVPTLRRTVARHAPVLPLRRPLVVVPLRGPPVGSARRLTDPVHHSLHEGTTHARPTYSRAPRRHRRRRRPAHPGPRRTGVGPRHRHSERHRRRRLRGADVQRAARLRGIADHRASRSRSRRRSCRSRRPATRCARWRSRWCSSTSRSRTPTATSITERVGEVRLHAPDRRCPTATATRSSCRCSCPTRAGETLAFPVIQTCEKGETGWTEVAGRGPGPRGARAPGPDA